MDIGYVLIRNLIFDQEKRFLNDKLSILPSILESITKLIPIAAPIILTTSLILAFLTSKEIS